MIENAEEVVERLDNVRSDLFFSMRENDLQPNEALTLLTSILVQIYDNFVENNSRENLIEVMGLCYDAYVLLNAEPEGGIH
jgi:hypothetical protein